MIEVKGLKNQLVHSKETTYFALTLVFSILAYLGLLFSIVGIMIIGVIVLFSYCLHALSMASIRRNGVRISQQQFPEIYAKAELLAQKMELNAVPNIYVMESQGLLNAFATRFFGKEMVVIFSEIFDLHAEHREDELLYVLAHEFAHLKRRHVLVHFFLLPAMYVPFLGEAYMRACEYTCDRYAAYYAGNLEASKEALVMLAIGKKLSGRVNQEAFVQQINEEQGFFSWISEKLSTHPDLPKRINALEHWVYPEQYHLVKETKRGPIIAVIVSIILFAAVIGGSLAFAHGSNALATWLAAGGSLEDDYLYEEDPIDVPALHMAIENNDLDELQQLLDDGADIEETDSEGSTALQHAVMWTNDEAVELLLLNGADVNTTDDWGTTPLINAVLNCEDTKIAKLLLEKGADPTLKDSSNKTAYEYALEYKDRKHVDLLE
ncbi:M48 family metallopeptidase [Bacillus benzoevorans]|uniref:Zn-dependent protease with chaperone function n=1 Tax=Bacillus benzoevorans TaxID=1456 RepID=A0A7X0LUX2_9BACI|nr:M48 family metallopeptidase [Bacillus benzoevorans]MBB6443997.1 Zn-dependent protease with chaperone function [Bacillus benzoevorans]